MYRLVGLIFNLAELILLARIVISWLPVNRDNQFVDLLYKITEPVLSPIRELIGRKAGKALPFDFSGIVALVLLAVLRQIIISIIF
jgi:YggT family protein